jgi:hypothetical protein
MPLDRWLPGFNFDVEEWSADLQNYETLAICRTPSARAAFEEKPAGRRRSLARRTATVRRLPRSARLAQEKGGLRHPRSSMGAHTAAGNMVGAGRIMAAAARIA